MVAFGLCLFAFFVVSRDQRLVPQENTNLYDNFTNQLTADSFLGGGNEQFYVALEPLKVHGLSTLPQSDW